MFEPASDVAQSPLESFAFVFTLTFRTGDVAIVVVMAVLQHTCLIEIQTVPLGAFQLP